MFNAGLISISTYCMASLLLFVWFFLLFVLGFFCLFVFLFYCSSSFLKKILYNLLVARFISHQTAEVKSSELLKLKFAALFPAISSMCTFTFSLPHTLTQTLHGHFWRHYIDLHYFTNWGFTPTITITCLTLTLTLTLSTNPKICIFSNDDTAFINWTNWS